MKTTYQPGENQRQSGPQETAQTSQQTLGYTLHTSEIRFDDFGLTWGTYLNPAPQTLTVHPSRTAVVSHIRLTDSGFPKRPKAGTLAENQFVVYREPAHAYELHLAATSSRPRLFFELSLSEGFFTRLLTNESPFLTNFPVQPKLPSPDLTFSARVVPAMHTLITQMQQTTYQGHLRELYLEAKAIELFLVQVQQLDGLPALRPITLSARDIDCLYEVKNQIDAHYEQPGSLLDLARQVGINQQKLKHGFKVLFNTTVFGYVTEVRMEEAKRLLLDERLLVNEVADRIGYKHPQHFTAAFKRRYGYLPKALKS